MRLFIFCFVLLFTACGPSIDPAMLDNLNGYWEIEEVHTADGQTRTYPASQTIDYFNLDGKSGYRKKVQPRLDGTFATSDDAIPFRLHQRNDHFYLQYQSGDERWEEELSELETNRFSLRQAGGMTYHYKRYEPLQL